MLEFGKPRRFVSDIRHVSDCVAAGTQCGEFTREKVARVRWKGTAKQTKATMGIATKRTHDN